jgi:hypothetical protein
MPNFKSVKECFPCIYRYMKEWHRELESVTARIGIQLGINQVGRESSIILFPSVEIGWNWRICIGLQVCWLFGYIGLYVITPAYKKSILERRQHHKDKPEDLKWRTSIND